MATESRDIKLSYKADISNLQRQLAEVPGITEKEAKAMAKALDRQLRKAEAAAKKAANASRKEFGKLKQEVDQTAESMKGLEDATGDTDSALMGVAGALDFINPKLADSTRMVAEFSAGVEGMSRIGPIIKALTGPLGLGLLAVGTFALAWKDAADEMEAAEERMKAATKAAEDMQRVVSGFKAAELTAELELAVALGEESAEMLKARNAQLRAEAASAGALTEATKLMRETQENLNKTQAEADRLRENRRSLSVKEIAALIELEKEEERLGSRLNKNKDVIDGINRRTANLAAKYLEAADANEKRGKASKNTAKNKEKEAETTAKAAEAVDAYADALAREDAAMAKIAAQEQARIQAQQKLNQMIAAANDDALDGYDKIELEINNQISQLKTLAKTSEDLIGIDQAMAAIGERGIRELMRLRDEADARETEQAQQRLERIAAENEERRAGMVTLLSSTSESFATFSEMAAESSGKASIRLFRLSQAAAIGEVAMNTAEAITKVTAQLGILAPAGIAAVSALGAAQAAVIASESPPSFHAGMAPDERNARLLQGEGVLSRQGVAAAGGAQAVRDLNNGNAGSGQIVVQNVYRHRVFDSFVQDNLNRAGPLRAALKRGSGRVGHK
tara:strand:- start:804 stop:2675 length:1872 start_codon:yes stop_codon:yes gene_type:complete